MSVSAHSLCRYVTKKIKRKGNPKATIKGAQFEPDIIFWKESKEWGGGAS